MAILAFKISDNIAETPEGFLLCKNVNIGRTGPQDYYGHEIGRKDLGNKLVKVYRLPENVFDKEAMRSFESKPVATPHPPGNNGITPHNAKRFVCGHARNIRQDGDYLVADLLINDATLIKLILDHKIREVSCGYACEYEPYLDGFKQVNITGNHVAVVERGRAGPRVSITDSFKKKKGATTKMDNTKIIEALISQDATPEQVAAMVKYLSQDTTKAVAAPVSNDKTAEMGLIAKLMAKFSKDEEAEKEEAETKKKETEDAALKAKIDTMQATIDELTAKKPKAKAADADALDAYFAADDDEDKENTEDDDDEDEGKKQAADAAIHSLAAALKPVLAKLPEKDKQIAKDAIRAQLGKKPSENKYAAITNIVNQAKDAAAAQNEPIDWNAFAAAQQAVYQPHAVAGFPTSAAELMAKAKG
jgi:hypothetical protein